jgi:hypothetical protein
LTTKVRMSTKQNRDRTLAPSWQIHFFKRSRDIDPRASVPGREFLESCPEKVRVMMVAVLDAVRDAPPPAFSGGGKWEAMHDEMAGFYEVRVDGPQRRHYRLFCVLEQDDPKKKLGGPAIVIIDGRSKAFRTVLSAHDYAAVRKLGAEYLARTPRSIAR